MLHRVKNLDQIISVKRDIFKKFSVKEVEKGQYVYYYYHRQNALKDLQKIKPVHIRSNSIYISDKV